MSNPYADESYEPIDGTYKFCAGPNCNKRVPKARGRAKYCSVSCKNRTYEQKRKLRNYQKKIAAGEAIPPEISEQVKRTHRKGKTYRDLVQTGLGDALIERKVSMSAVAEMLDVSPAEVTRALEAYGFLIAQRKAAESWQMDDEVAALFPAHRFDELRALGLDAEDTDEFQQVAAELVDTWVAMQDRYFTIGQRETAMVVKDFHREWVYEAVVAFTFGLKVLIIAPPRHGKTEVMMRILVWLFVMFPNFCALWVGSSSGLVKGMASAIKEQFESNELLRTDLLPPQRSFQPARHDPNKPWGANEFTLATRTALGMKSPTMCALGSTAKIPGRDVDGLIIDDLEDLDSVGDADQRRKKREKHAEIMERKEPHTFAITICSRQHPDDIPNYLMGKEGDDAWRIRVYSAHADWCDLDPDVEDGHDTNGCVLFPEVRPYRWLLEKKREYESLQLHGRYEMRILNRPTPQTGIVFRVAEIREHALDRSRVCGVHQLPASEKLAGIDPASRGVQAAFGWAWTDATIYMIDLETQQAGGFEGAFRLIEDWVNRYEIYTFVYEDNATQSEFFRDPRFFDLLRRYPGLQIVPHTTGRNKHDPELGISSMAPDFHSGRINLPYGDATSRRKVNEYLAQLALWTTDGLAKRGRTDIKMASWLPWARLQLLSRKARATEPSVVKQTGNPYPVSYPGIDRFSSMDTTPW